MNDKEDPSPFSFSAADLMPEWAQESTKSEKPQKKTPQNKYRDFDPDDRKGRGGQGRGGRGGQHGGRRGGGRERRDFGGGGRGGDKRGGGDRRGGGRGRGGPGGRDQRGGRDGGRERREDPIPRGFTLKFAPTPLALKALNKHIRETFRTYPLIDLAKMIINSRERYQIDIQAESGKGAKLYQCKSDGSTWLTREEAMSHFLGTKECLDHYYAVEEVEIGAPKGNFSVVAVCGMSGVILGPPNHHEYQKKIAGLHAERFSHMNLEGFKSRINMANDEEAIEKWKEQVSRTLHYRLKSDEPENVPEVIEEESPAENAEETAVEKETGPVEETPVENEPVAETDPQEVVEAADKEPDAEEAEDSTETKEEPESISEEKEDDALLLKTQEELKLHFRENFAEEEIIEADSVTVNGNIPGKLLSRGLLNLIKKESEQLRRGFPLPMIQAICNGLEKHRLRFFKRGKKSLHVSAIRPRALSKSVVLTERIQKIVDLISLPQRCDVSSLLEVLVEGFKKPATKEEADKMELSDAAKEVLTDLRWLTSEGLVLEFPDTRLVLGKVPQQQPKQKKKAAQKKVTKEIELSEEAKSEESVSEEKEPEVMEAAKEEEPSSSGTEKSE